MTTDSEGTREVSPSGKAAIEEARVALWEDCGHVPLGDPIRSVKAAVFCDSCGPQILESLVHKVTEDAAVEARRLREQRTAAEDERDEQYQRHIRRIGDLESKLKEAERDQQALGAQLHETELVLTQWRDRAEVAERERDQYTRIAERASEDADTFKRGLEEANARVGVPSSWNGVIHTGTVDQLRASARGLAEALREALEILERQFASLPPELSVSEAWQFAKARLERYRAALSEWEAAEER